MKKTVLWRSYRHDLNTVMVQADIYSVDGRTGQRLLFQGGVVRDVKRDVKPEEFRRIIGEMTADLQLLDQPI